MKIVGYGSGLRFMARINRKLKKRIKDLEIEHEALEGRVYDLEGRVSNLEATRYQGRTWWISDPPCQPPCDQTVTITCASQTNASAE